MGHKEGMREPGITYKNKSDQSVAKLHPSAVRLSVIGKNQLQAAAEQAACPTQDLSADAFRGPVPKHFDRRRSDLPLAPSLIQMIQHNQRAVEAQVKLIKSNSNSLLPNIPAGILSQNTSLNLTPDAS